MNSPAPRARRPDGLRDARRRGRAHGVHDVPHVPRPPPARGLARLRADARRVAALQALGDGPARALLRRHLRQPQDGLLVADGDAGHARPARRLRRHLPRRERPLRLPAAVAARQRRALAQARPARADRLDRRRRRRAVAPDGGRRRRRRVPRRARDDRHGRPLALAHRARRSTSPGAFADWKVLQPSGANARCTPRSRCAPRSARRWSTAARPRHVARRGAAAGRGDGPGDRGRRPRDVARTDDARARDRRRARRAALRAAATRRATSAAGAGTSTASSTRCWRASRTACFVSDALPRRAARACGRR